MEVPNATPAGRRVPSVTWGWRAPPTNRRTPHDRTFEPLRIEAPGA